jgi:hypothetical protein
MCLRKREQDSTPVEFWVRLRLVVLVFCLSGLLMMVSKTYAQSQEENPNQDQPRPRNIGPALPRSWWAPLLRSLELPYGELALNNRSPQASEVTLIFYSKNGKPADEIKLTIEPGEVKHLDLDELLPTELKHQPELGAINVQYTGQWNQVASQLTLISRDRKSSIDEPLRPDADFRSGVQHAVWHMPKDGHAVIALGNTSEESVSAALVLPGGISRKLLLRPNATEVIRLYPDSAPSRSKDNRVASVQLETTGRAGALRAIGYVTFGGYARTIRFYDPETVRQPDLFAANLSPQHSEVQLVLKNIGRSPLAATPQFIPAVPGSGTPVDLAPVNLEPGEEKLVDTSLLGQMAAANDAYSRVSVHVRNSGAKGTLIGALSSFNWQEGVSIELPLRDSGSLRNSGGSYPIRLDGDYSTIVTLMNVSDESVEFIGFIRHSLGE